MTDTGWIRFPCEHCSKSLRVAAANEGKRIRCPGCGMGSTVPLSLDDPSSAPAPKPAPKPAAKPRPLPPPPAPRTARPALPPPPTPVPPTAPAARVCPQCWMRFTVSGPAAAGPVPCPAPGCGASVSPQVGADEFEDDLEPTALVPSWQVPAAPGADPDEPDPPPAPAASARPGDDDPEPEARLARYDGLLLGARLLGLIFLCWLGVAWYLYPTIPEGTIEQIFFRDSSPRGVGKRETTFDAAGYLGQAELSVRRVGSEGVDRTTVATPGMLPFLAPWVGLVACAAVACYAVHRASAVRAGADPEYRTWVRRGVGWVAVAAILAPAAYLPWQASELARQRVRAEYQLSEFGALLADRGPSSTLDAVLARDEVGGAFLRVDPVTGGPLAYFPRWRAAGRADPVTPVVAHYPAGPDGIQPVLLPDGIVRFVHESRVVGGDAPGVAAKAPEADTDGVKNPLWGKKSGEFFGRIGIGLAVGLGPLIALGVLGWYVPGRYPNSPVRRPAQVVSTVLAGLYAVVGLFASLLLFGSALDGAPAGDIAARVLGGLVIGGLAVAMIVVAVRLGRAAGRPAAGGVRSSTRPSPVPQRPRTWVVVLAATAVGVVVVAAGVTAVSLSRESRDRPAGGQPSASPGSGAKDSPVAQAAEPIAATDIRMMAINDHPNSRIFVPAIRVQIPGAPERYIGFKSSVPVVSMHTLTILGRFDDGTKSVVAVTPMQKELRAGGVVARCTGMIESVAGEGEAGGDFTLYVTSRRIVGVEQAGRLLYVAPETGP